MGVIAGLLQLRKEEDQNHDKTFLHDIFPWTFTEEEFYEISQESREISWQRRVDRNFLFLVSIILFGLLKTVLPGIPNLNLMTQFSCVHLQLIVMVGLTRDGGRSWLSRICRLVYCVSWISISCNYIQIKSVVVHRKVLNVNLPSSWPNFEVPDFPSVD